MNIKTKERNPNPNGEVEAPIVLIDKINASRTVLKLPAARAVNLALCFFRI